jgi:uncharacterized membrane protein
MTGKSQADDPTMEALLARVTSLESRIEWLERIVVGAAPARPGLAPAAHGLGSPVAAAARRPPTAPPPPADPVAHRPKPPANGALWGTAVSQADSRPQAPSGAAASPLETRAVTRTPSVVVQRPPLTFRDIEERFTGRVMAWTGGLALLAAAVFFLSLAFSRGWIGEELRVVIGLATGTLAFGLGAFMLFRGTGVVGNVLVAVGLGIASIAVMAATRLYGLVPPELGLGAALVLAIAAAALAIRFDSPAVAAYGLVAALVAPPLTGASTTLLTLAFVAVTLAGTTAIALFRTWRWLPPLAFVLAAPQVAAWVLGEPAPLLALTGVVGFWFLNLLAAAGEEVRVRRDDLRPSSATLVLANAAFLVAMVFVILGGDLEAWLGPVVAAIAVAHVGVGAWFLARQGDRHLFGNLVGGTGAAVLALAAAVQFDGSAVPVAWAAEAVALTWLAVRRAHGWSAAAAAVLAGMAVAWVLAIAYPPHQFGEPVTDAPFLHSVAVAPAAAIAALLIALVLVPVRRVRALLGGLAVLVAAWVIPFELRGASATAGLVALLLAAVTLERLLPSLGQSRTHPFRRRAARIATLRWAALAGLVAWALAGVLALLGPLSWTRMADGQPPVPFTDVAAVMGGLLALGILAAATILPLPWLRRVAVAAALLVGAWLVPFETALDGAVLAWSALAGTALVVVRLDARLGTVARPIAAGLVLLAVLTAVVAVAPPAYLAVMGPAAYRTLLPAWAPALLAIAAILAVFSRDPWLEGWRAVLVTAAGGVLVWLASIAVIVPFQGRVGAGMDWRVIEEIGTQAQVALSVLWMVLGAGAFVAGLAWRREIARLGGLALLALATGKVFLFDLAALDVAYRVLSLAALGLLLLASAYFLGRLRGPHGGPRGMPGSGTIDG